MSLKEAAAKLVLITFVFVALTSARLFFPAADVQHMYSLTIIGLIVFYCAVPR